MWAWLILIRFKKQDFSAQHPVFIILPHHNRSTKLENMVNIDLPAPIFWQVMHSFYTRISFHLILIVNKKIWVAKCQLLSYSIHFTLVWLQKKSYKKNVNKSYIVAYLVQQKFLWQTYLSFEEIFDIPFSFLHFILHFHNTSLHVFTTTRFS